MIETQAAHCARTVSRNSVTSKAKFILVNAIDGDDISTVNFYELPGGIRYLFLVSSDSLCQPALATLRLG
eukprot:4228229-Pyramimonas_sp.AAC.1